MLVLIGYCSKWFVNSLFQHFMYQEPYLFRVCNKGESYWCFLLIIRSGTHNKGISTDVLQNWNYFQANITGWYIILMKTSIPLATGYNKQASFSFFGITNRGTSSAVVFTRLPYVTSICFNLIGKSSSGFDKYWHGWHCNILDKQLHCVRSSRYDMKNIEYFYDNFVCSV